MRLEVETYGLRGAGEGVLIAYALLGLVGLSFDDVGHRVLRTSAVDDLLRRVVRVVDERPRDVAEVAALGQLLHRLARLQSITKFTIQFHWISLDFIGFQLEPAVISRPRSINQLMLTLRGRYSVSCNHGSTPFIQKS